MDIKFLGTGGAFDVELGNSSAIVQVGGENILIDCGFSIFPKLIKTELIKQLDKILITHLHDDHVGGLSSLILYYYFKLNLGKVEILFPNEKFKDELYSFLKATTVFPEKYVEFSPLSKCKNIQCIDTSGEHVDGMTSFGYAFFESDQAIVYSGDIGNADTIFEWLKKHKVNKPTIFHDLCFHYDGVHAFYKDLIPYSKDYKILGYHCNPKENRADNPITLVASQKEYIFELGNSENTLKDSKFFIYKRA